MLAILANTFLIMRIRFRTKPPGKEADESVDVQLIDGEGDLPFQKANITFKNICYSVKSSITKDEIILLKGVDGYFEAGKMTALM